jgi:hypothetical protein
VAACGPLAAQDSYILTKDLVSPGGSCLTIAGNGATLDLNGHSIRGVPGTSATGIVSGNNVTIKGPGIVHDFDFCIVLGTYGLVEDVLTYNCAAGITMSHASKCVQCRVHDARSSTSLVTGIVGGIGIILGNGCLLESSIVENSDNGALVGQDCKVWDLVVDSFIRIGLKVGAGTSVARSVISHFHDGPGLDYTTCPGTLGVAVGCQDSSNSVWPGSAALVPTIIGAPVITDCATNNNGVKYIPTAPILQCP